MEGQRPEGHFFPMAGHLQSDIRDIVQPLSGQSNTASRTTYQRLFLDEIWMQVKYGLGWCRLPCGTGM